MISARINQKGFVYLAPLIIIGLILVGLFYYLLGQGNFRPQETSYQGPVDKISIANIGEYSIFNIIAKEKGYFIENGLEAEVREFDAGPAAIAELQKGNVNFAVAAEFVGVRNIFTDKNLRIISQASKHKTFNVIGRKDKGINKESDLKGKTIGVTKKSAGEFFLGRFLTFNNLKESELTVLDLPPGEMVKRIEDGSIDSIVIFDPHAYSIQKKLGDKVILWSAQEEQKTFALIYTTKSQIDNSADIVDRYLKSLNMAQNFLEKNEKEANRILIDKLQYAEDYVAHMRPNFDFELGLSQELLITIEDQARWVIDKKLVEESKVPNYLDYFYIDALEKVDPNSITLIY